VSELYGLGLNAAFGVLLGTAVLGARQARLGRWTLVGVNASMTAALLIGLVGVLGRAHHFEITWKATAAGNQTLVAALEKAGTARPATPIHACFEPACRPPYRYAQYVIPLQQSMDIPHTVPWATRRWPGVRLNVSYDRTCDTTLHDTVPMPCSLISDHGRW